mgnify:CR=1 FL=1
MRAFAALLDRLSFTASRNAKLRLIRDHLADAPDPDRGWALAALTGGLSFKAAKPAMIRHAVEARVDAELFRAKLRSASFYDEWKKKFGDDAWALLEKYTGKLA